MDPNTVSDVITALVCTYAAGLEYYSAWQRRSWRDDHYRKSPKANIAIIGSCALSTSLIFSESKIREAFDGGVEILGSGFAVGDEACRDILHDNLERLRGRIELLEGATPADDRPLELCEVIRVSETVRISCLAALAEQYKRVAVGRLVPRELPGSRRQSRLSASAADESVVTPTEDNARTIRQITTTASSTSRSPFQSEPPSPPPTPKMIPDDLQSTCTSASSGFGTRPKNSVFSVFCPGAMKYQVNLKKTIPKGGKCRCGYDWNGKHTEDRAAIAVKNGFQITPRFLGKSHCEGGFGCVLCTSSGKTETYESVEGLRDHVNASHTKWQLLHDRDMAGR